MRSRAAAGRPASQAAVAGAALLCAWLSLLAGCGYLDLLGLFGREPEAASPPEGMCLASGAGRSVRQTDDGGYIIAGVRQDPTAGDDNAYLIKTKPDGTLEWERQFGSQGVRVLEAASCVRQTADGGYILAGYTNSEGAGDFDAWLIKTDADGNEVWRRTFGGGMWDQAEAVQQTADGGYILAGMTHFKDKDAWLVKTDPSGNKEWSKTFGSVQVDWGYAVQQRSDGGHVLVGDTLSFPEIAGTGVYLVLYTP